MYRLNDKVFIDKMVQNGRKPIRNADDVKRYCNLAKEFWKFKQV